MNRSRRRTCQAGALVVAQCGGARGVTLEAWLRGDTGARYRLFDSGLGVGSFPPVSTKRHSNYGMFETGGLMFGRGMIVSLGFRLATPLLASLPRPTEYVSVMSPGYDGISRQSQRFSKETEV